MKLVLYNNKSGFRPSGKVLEYWKFLPQTQVDKDVPSLYGNIKSMLIPNLIVIILILCEVGLFYTMQEEGVNFMTLLALSIFDFVIGILPAIIFIYGNLIMSVIKTNIFIAETKLTKPNEIPYQYNGNLDTYQGDLRAELQRYKKQKTSHHVIQVIMAMAILALAFWKFISLYDVLGQDIFILGIGRYIIVVLILSIIAHIFFTKTVFANIIFKSMFNKQKSAYDKDKQYSISPPDRNQMKDVTFHGKYTYASEGNQFVARKLEDAEQVAESDRTKIREVKVIGNDYSDGENEVLYFSKRKSETNNGVVIVYTGILNDPEIGVLAIAQSNEQETKGILATAKQIQLSFN